jgi:hypothetical protein
MTARRVLGTRAWQLTPPSLDFRAGCRCPPLSSLWASVFGQFDLTAAELILMISGRRRLARQTRHYNFKLPLCPN